MTEVSHHKIEMSPKRLALLKRIGFIFGFIAIVYVLYYVVWGKFTVTTDDAYVSGNIIQIMPQVNGTISSIHTDTTQWVVVGQPLIQLNDEDTLLVLQKARANLATTVRQVSQTYEKAKQAQAELALTQSELKQAKDDYHRRVGLVGEKVISGEEMQHYLTQLNTATSRYNQSLHAYSAYLALVNHTSLYHHPQVELAITQFKKANLDWSRTVIRSPAIGYVAKRSAQVGQQVTTDSILLAVVPLRDIWVDANFKENQIKRLRIGQEVVLTADANDVTYHGKVVGLEPGTGSAFALLPPQNATGNWIKIVQRVPVRISLDPKEVYDHPLQIGLSMKVTVYTRWLRGDILPTALNTNPIYFTSIYNHPMPTVDADIQSILKANASDIALSMPDAPQELTHA